MSSAMTLNPYFFNLSENPRASATNLLRDAGVADVIPVDLVKLCRRQDWALEFRDLGDDRDAFIRVDGEGRVTICINTDESNEKDSFSSDPVLRARQRFSMAHEIGHACLQTHTDKELQKRLDPKVNPHGVKYQRTRESQANEFASELLMPQHHIEERLRRFAWDSFFAGVETIAEEFEVSLLACAMRIAAEAPFPAMCLFFNNKAQLHQVPARSRDHKDTGFFFPTRGLIPKGSLADDLANKPDCNTRKRKQSNCARWFPDSRNAEMYELDEQAIRLGRYGYLVFLSFIEKEVEY